MNDFIAIIAAQDQMHEQFRDIPEQDRPAPHTQAPRQVRTALRLRLSAALHAVANAIEPAQHDPAYSPSPQR